MDFALDDTQREIAKLCAQVLDRESGAQESDRSWKAMREAGLLGHLTREVLDRNLAMIAGTYVLTDQIRSGFEDLEVDSLQKTEIVARADDAQRRDSRRLRSRSGLDRDCDPKRRGRRPCPLRSYRFDPRGICSAPPRRSARSRKR